MTDQELFKKKVLSVLNSIGEDNDLHCNKCPYRKISEYAYCIQTVAHDVYDLIKRNVPVNAVDVSPSKIAINCWLGNCPTCNKRIVHNGDYGDYEYCRHCGQKILWDTKKENINDGG